MAAAGGIDGRRCLPTMSRTHTTRRSDAVACWPLSATPAGGFRPCTANPPFRESRRCAGTTLWTRRAAGIRGSTTLIALRGFNCPAHPCSWCGKVFQCARSGSECCPAGTGDRHSGPAPYEQLGAQEAAFCSVLITRPGNATEPWAHQRPGISVAGRRASIRERPRAMILCAKPETRFAEWIKLIFGARQRRTVQLCASSST